MFATEFHRGPIAQLVEQLAFNQWVAGSSPARLTTTLNAERAVHSGLPFPFMCLIGKLLMSATRTLGPRAPSPAMSPPHEQRFVN